MSYKRLVPKLENSSFSEKRSTPKSQPKKIKDKEIPTEMAPALAPATDIYIVDYTENSFLVMGNTISHSKNLGGLGGTFGPTKKYGVQWLFAGFRKESVKKYIKEGIVEPAKWVKKETTQAEKVVDQRMKFLFEELKGAFDSESEYMGESILNVFKLLEQKYKKS